jgi:glutathione S-transferase
MSHSVDLTLYHAAPSRSMTARWMLEELGEPFTLEVLDLQKDDHRQPAYLAVNPMGQVPALRHGDVVVTETAAICAYLADAFPARQLAPALDSPLRGPYLRWMFFAPSVLEPLALDRMLNRGRVSQRSVWFDHDRVLDVLEDAVRDREFIVGDQFTAADVLVGNGILWGMKMVQVLPERHTLLEYAERFEQRPARQRQMAADTELMQR